MQWFDMGCMLAKLALMDSCNQLMLCSSYFYLNIFIDPGDAAVQLFMGLCMHKLHLFFFNQPSYFSQLYRTDTLYDVQAVQ